MRSVICCPHSDECMVPAGRLITSISQALQHAVPPSLETSFFTTWSSLVRCSSWCRRSAVVSVARSSLVDPVSSLLILFCCSASAAASRDSTSTSGPGLSAGRRSQGAPRRWLRHSTIHLSLSGSLRPSLAVITPSVFKPIIAPVRAC